MMPIICPGRACFAVSVTCCEACGKSHIIVRHVGHIFAIRTTDLSCYREREIELEPVNR